MTHNALSNLFGGPSEPDIPDEALYDLNVAITALRRIRSLDPKNVKYAQQIAREALKRIE